MRVDLPLRKNVLVTPANNVLLPLGVTAAASAKDATNQTKIYGSGMTTLIISNEEVDHIIKIVKSLEELSLWIKDISETIENEVKGQKGGLLSMLFDTLAASVLGNVIAGKGVIRAGERLIIVREDFHCHLIL